MKKNSLMKKDGSIIRILDISSDKLLMIDCLKKSMPKWVELSFIESYTEITNAELLQSSDIIVQDMDSFSAESKRFIHEHYTMIAGILPFVSEERERTRVIKKVAEEKNVNQRTIRNYLCLYLAYQDISVLAPKQKSGSRALTQDEKNIRWALNRFFYNKHKNSLTTAYTMMLKEKYCDGEGKLLPEHPSIHQFRYFERKHRKMQTYYISRDGLKSYQRNNRPLLGDGVQEFASHVGIAMLDATVCDIYLVNESGNLVGRPLLVVAIDAYSSLCCGYSLSWESGTYSLRGLMLNVISDKVKHCEQFGIMIDKSDWNCDSLPATLVTDMGSEYKSENFEQLAELGVTIVNLPSYRPELKGQVEKAFDLIQGYFKPYLKGRGIIEPDFQERGARDYRKDAALTMEQFEKVLIRCIIYYNSRRIIENYPYSENMLKANVRPYASDIWNWGLCQTGADLLKVSANELILTLLPRTTGKFTRQGLKVNGLRYKHENFTEKYLSGDTAAVAYNPDDVSCAWLIEKGAYICFELIESRFEGVNLSKVEELKDKQKILVKDVVEDNLQAQIELASHIEAIVSSATAHENVEIKGIRKNREKEKQKNHVDYVKEGVCHV